MFKYAQKIKMLNVLAAFALVVLGILILSRSNSLAQLTQQNNSDRFEWKTQQITEHIRLITDDYSSALVNGRSFFLNSREVTNTEWVGFFQSQAIFDKLAGSSNVFYIKVVNHSDKSAFEKTALSLPQFAGDFKIQPAGTRDKYGVVSLAVSLNPVKVGGFDVFSDPDRKAVYDRSAQTGLASASSQLKLVGGDIGFFVILPVNVNSEVVGFINISLHSKEFFESAITDDHLTVANIKITDTTDTKSSTELYKSPEWQDSFSYRVSTSSILFGGRTWKIDFQERSTQTDNIITTTLPYMTLGSGLLLLVVIFGAIYFSSHNTSKRF